MGSATQVHPREGNDETMKMSLNLKKREKKAAPLQNGITEGVIWQQLLLYFFPILLGTFFQQLYNTVDAVIVGNFVGKQALAAVGGSTSTIINLLVGFFVGLSSGATVIISQFYGAGRQKETSDAVHTSIALALSGGVLLTVVGLAISSFSLQAMGTPEEIMPDALTYMRIYFAGTVFSLIYNIGSGILRAVGDSKRPLYFLIVCSLTNLVLDLLFVLAFNMGVLGVALATIISQAVSACLVIVTLLRSATCFKLYIRKIRLHLHLLGQIVRIGLPAGLQSMMYSISNLTIQSSINAFGTDSIAAWTAYGKIDGLFWMIMGAFGVTITTFVGQNFGAGKYGRMRRCVKTCLLMAFGASVLLSCLLMLFGRYILGIFTSDAGVLTLGMQILWLMAPFYFAYVCIELLSGAMRGAGEALVPMLMTCVGICVLRVVWVLCAVPLHNTLRMVIISYPLTWAVTSVFYVLYYRSNRWIKKRLPEGVDSTKDAQ